MQVCNCRLVPDVGNKILTVADEGGAAEGACGVRPATSNYQSVSADIPNGKFLLQD